VKSFSREDLERRLAAAVSTVQQVQDPSQSHASQEILQVAPSWTAASQPADQSASDILTFLIASNIPLMSKEEITQAFMSFAGLAGSKVDVRPDARNPGTNMVRARFVDYESAQSCLNALSGRPFSPLHNIGPVQNLSIRQVSKDTIHEQKKRQMQQMPSQYCELTPFQSQQHIPQQLQHPQPSQHPLHMMQPVHYSTSAVSYGIQGSNTAMMQQQGLQPSHGLPQQFMHALNHSNSQNFHSQPFFMEQNSNPLSTHSHQFYQQQQHDQFYQQQQHDQFYQQQQHDQSTESFQQNNSQLAFQCSQAQQFPMQAAPVQRAMPPSYPDQRSS
jgi:hypothetical protein